MSLKQELESYLNDPRVNCPKFLKEDILLLVENCEKDRCPGKIGHTVVIYHGENSQC